MFGRSYDVFYGYDLTGALTTETYPSGRVIATGYDRAGRSLQVQGTGVVYAQNVAFAPHGAATSRLMANGALQETMSYTTGLQPASKLLQKVTPLTTHWRPTTRRTGCARWARRAERSPRITTAKDGG